MEYCLQETHSSVAVQRVYIHTIDWAIARETDLILQPWFIPRGQADIIWLIRWAHPKTLSVAGLPGVISEQNLAAVVWGDLLWLTTLLLTLGNSTDLEIVFQELGTKASEILYYTSHKEEWWTDSCYNMDSTLKAWCWVKEARCQKPHIVGLWLIWNVQKRQTHRERR